MSPDREHVATIILDAAAYGDREAAKRHQVSVRTVFRYRAAMQTDKDLASFVSERAREHESALCALRVRFLRKALAEMERRIGLPDTKLAEIAEAVKVVGELHQVAEVMGDGGSDGDDSEATEAPGGSVSQASATH